MLQYDIHQFVTLKQFVYRPTKYKCTVQYVRACHKGVFFSRKIFRKSCFERFGSVTIDVFFLFQAWLPYSIQLSRKCTEWKPARSIDIQTRDVRVCTYIMYEYILYILYSIESRDRVPGGYTLCGAYKLNFAGRNPRQLEPRTLYKLMKQVLSNLVLLHSLTKTTATVVTKYTLYPEFD